MVGRVFSTHNPERVTVVTIAQTKKLELREMTSCLTKVSELPMAFCASAQASPSSELPPSASLR